ncbi:MAG TPA: SagB/ThcOx family dehydrogenase [Candidatus Methylomirabilis sp.]|nr:SagB/ThcOx family dehydrogenase [Candidatus Methylomirabilis sp.]
MPVIRAKRLRRAASLVSYWRDGRLVFENFLTCDRVTAVAFTLLILDFFGRWRSPSEFYASFSNYSRKSLAATLRQLQTHHLLLSEGSYEDRRDASVTSTWSSWLPAAGMLQFGSQNIRYQSNLAKVRRRFLQRAKEHVPPSPVKHYVHAAQFSLPSPEQHGALPEVLLARRTWRRFSRRTMQLQQLATLLGLTWGVQSWVRFPGVGRLALKTSPSAGARHPIEVYVLAVNVAGLPRGIYHYAADTHRLERLKSHAAPRDIVNFLGNQWWYAPACALLLMTAVFPRNQWKYRDSIAYRTVMIDAGHVCQTFCLVATWLGLAPFCTMAFDQVLVEKELRIDGVQESLVYAAGVGTRPKGVAWAPWPRPGDWAGVTTV